MFGRIESLPIVILLMVPLWFVFADGGHGQETPATRWAMANPAGSAERVKNLPVRPRGHNDYWTDPEVLKTLAAQQLLS